MERKANVKLDLENGNYVVNDVVNDKNIDFSSWFSAINPAEIFYM